MKLSEERLSLTNLGSGAAVEKFDDELQRVLDNIIDPNTLENSPRTVTLKVTINPKDRGYGTVKIDCNSKLAPPDTYNTQVYIGRDINGQGEAYEHNPEQLKLQFEERRREQTEKAHENVTPLSERSESK